MPLRFLSVPRALRVSPAPPRYVIPAPSPARCARGLLAHGAAVSLALHRPYNAHDACLCELLADALADDESVDFTAVSYTHPLLPEEAQWAIGQLHPVGELPFSILQDEGFDADTYIDIFDGGPTVEAPLASLRSVRLARAVDVQEESHGPRRWQLLVRPVRANFGAMLAEAGDQVTTADAQVLGARLGERLLATPLVAEEQA